MTLDGKITYMKTLPALKCCFLVLLALSSGCGYNKKVSEDRVEVAPDTFVVITKMFSSGVIEGSVHTYLSVKWPSSYFLDSIGEADYYNRTEDIRLVRTGQHNIVVYGRSLFYRPSNGGRWAWWVPQNSLSVPPTDKNSIASFLKEWLERAGVTNFQYEADGQYHEERITFILPGKQGQYTIGNGANGAWHTMPYRYSSIDESANEVIYTTDIPSLPSMLIFTGPRNGFGAWSFDRTRSATRNEPSIH